MKSHIFRAAALAVCLTSATAAQTAPGFGEFRPDRGFLPFGSYSVSESESINEANGNLTLRIPLATLPAGRGGFRQGIGLVYNSQIYDLRTQSGNPANVVCGGGTPCPETVNVLTQIVESGNWQYSFLYRFDVDLRPGLAGCLASDERTFGRYRYTLVLPDGSSHVLRMPGSKDYNGDGYYRNGPDGSKACPFDNSVAPLPYPLRFYSTDGTFIQVTRTATEWTAVFPDGMRAMGPVGDAQAKMICDRNTNCVRIEHGFDSQLPRTDLIDDAGRRIRIRYNVLVECPTPPFCISTSDDISQVGVGGDGTNPTIGQPNVFFGSVVWTSVNVGKMPDAADPAGDPVTYLCRSPETSAEYVCKLATKVRVVERVILPTQTKQLSYYFSYADHNAPAGRKGWGELREVRLPNAAADAFGSDGHRPRVEYAYMYRPDAGGIERDARYGSENPVMMKKQYRRENVTGTATDVPVEEWSYTFPNHRDVTKGTIVGPDGGLTENFFLGQTHKRRTDIRGGGIVMEEGVAGWSDYVAAMGRERTVDRECGQSGPEERVRAIGVPQAGGWSEMGGHRVRI